MRNFHHLILLSISLSLVLTRGAAAEDGVVALSRTSQLPAYLLELPESVNDILIADVASASMRRFGRSGDSIVEKDRRYMSIGVNGTGKQRAWDRKTPLGVYFITEVIDTSRLHEKYGVAAYALDYPNAWDRQKQRTGSGIWLHGVDRRSPERPPRDTDGCLALPNEEISRLAGVLEPHVTPVIVARELAWSTADELKVTRLEFHRALDMWKDSLVRSDLDTYLSLYADDFQYREMNKDRWSSHQAGVFESRPLNGMKIEDVMLLADPEEANLFLSRFTQVLFTNRGPIKSTKRLYWRRSEDERWEIILEDSKPLQEYSDERFAVSLRGNWSDAPRRSGRSIAP
jgi:murein L,D-transpeptidase YafK